MLDQEQRKRLATRYRVRYVTLSPMHVGSGEEDLMPVAGDVIADGGKSLIVIDLEKLSPPSLTEREFDSLVTGGRSLRSILQRMESNRLRNLAAYELPRPAGRITRIARQAKSQGFEPYLPGSSVKGAIRTALAWAIYSGEPIQAGVNYVEKSGKYVDIVADDLVDAEIFRPKTDEPHYDVMRALQISDSSPDTRLGLSQVAVYSTQGTALVPKNFRLHVETILHNRELTASARLDRYLLDSPQAQAKLGFDTRRGYLEHFVRHLNGFAGALIDHEIAFFRQYRAPGVLRFYEKLKQILTGISDSESACLLYLGWGPGWAAKTIGTALDEATVAEVRNTFGRMGHRGFPVFPKSRRLEERESQPVAPLGWLYASFEPLG